ncbi:hypothetical protein LOK49_LG08G03136 [Camellia lanceoleosa]|uniref:Uncharacterized protein n=1 Tax=Camellia lanceoleosa TaxID=1840588 RepID=A0ACC0GVM3_9ERIC|nr:hypothetical protein LOK49_LG08G03136 [Camellia lanceoleosa]
MELLKEKLAGVELAQEEANNVSHIVHSDNVRLEHDVAFLKAVLDDTQKELHSTRGVLAGERARALQLQVWLPNDIDLYYSCFYCCSKLCYMNSSKVVKYPFRTFDPWVLKRSREEFDCVNGRTRPLPRQRWFGRSRSESSNSVAERVLQWRASIYEQHLRAVPCFSQSCLERNTAGNNGVKDRILKRIEPWIHRELKAIHGDPDPSVIVHVASSLFISGLEEKHEVPSKQFVLEDNFIEPLRPFLHERTNMFWHELRYIICI